MNNLNIYLDILTSSERSKIKEVIASNLLSIRDLYTTYTESPCGNFDCYIIEYSKFKFDIVTLYDYRALCAALNNNIPIFLCYKNKAGEYHIYSTKFGSGADYLLLSIEGIPSTTDDFTNFVRKKFEGNVDIVSNNVDRDTLTTNKIDASFIYNPPSTFTFDTREGILPQIKLDPPSGKIHWVEYNDLDNPINILFLNFKP